MWTDPAVIAEVVEFFARAKEAHGDRVELWVDCHARLSAPAAARLVHGLKGLVDVMEEPLPGEDVSGLLQLKEASCASWARRSTRRGWRRPPSGATTRRRASPGSASDGQRPHSREVLA